MWIWNPIPLLLTTTTLRMVFCFLLSDNNNKLYRTTITMTMTLMQMRYQLWCNHLETTHTLNLTDKPGFLYIPDNQSDCLNQINCFWIHIIDVPYKTCLSFSILWLFFLCFDCLLFGKGKFRSCQQTRLPNEQPITHTFFVQSQIISPPTPPSRPYFSTDFSV